MPDWLKGVLTVAVCGTLPPAATAAALGAAGALGGAGGVVVAAGAVGLLYGLEAGALTIYDLSRPKGWVELVIDVTWSLPSTALGLVAGNLIYLLYANPSRARSRHAGWVEYVPRRPTGFGHSVLQTLGTVNIGGAGQHERMHLLQARIFGPAYLPLIVVSYLVTGTIQVGFTATLGWVLALTGVRRKAYLRPPARSAVGGFVGWIYYATPFELWAYASGNP